MKIETAPLRGHRMIEATARVYFICSDIGLIGVTVPSSLIWSPGIRILLRSRWKLFAEALLFPALSRVSASAASMRKAKGKIHDPLQRVESPSPKGVFHKQVHKYAIIADCRFFHCSSNMRPRAASDCGRNGLDGCE